MGKEAKEVRILELCLDTPLDCWTVIVADGEDGEIEPAGAVWVLAVGTMPPAVSDAVLDCWTAMDVCVEAAEL
jgi:hypothetical protein